VIAFPFEGMGEGLPPAFESITRSHLLTLPVDARITYETFADELIEETGITWTSADPSFHRSILHTVVRRLAIRILDGFGVLQPEYEINPNNVGTERELVAFQVAPFGHGLLASLGEDR
jgi:hypothetical protein